jgi:4-amino-4-deoxychorismate lyase
MNSTVPNALVDGVATGRIDVQDRGLHYGDGLFETLAVRDGRPRFWSRHMARLMAGLERLGFPVVDERQLEAEAESLIRPGQQGVLKILLTRGRAGRGYGTIKGQAPSRVLLMAPWPEGLEAKARAGVAVRMCQLRLGQNPILAGIKHLNRLEQVMARSEWETPEIDEGLLCDGGERVIEGTRANLFMVRNGTLLTPELSASGVAGVMRSVVLDLARELGAPARVKAIHRRELSEADELFLTNSLQGIVPIRHLQQQQWTDWPLTRRLQEALATTEEGTAWYP